MIITFHEGTTYTYNAQNAIQYAQENGYPNSTVEYYWGNNINHIHSAIMAEVHA